MEIEFIEENTPSWDTYINVVQHAALHEALELDENLQPINEKLGVIFSHYACRNDP